MTQVEILDSHRALSPADIRSFEQQHGVSIPSSYAAFLLRHNGGSPSPENFEVLMEPRAHAGRKATVEFATAVEFFLSLDEEDLSVLERLSYVREQRVQPGMFPVAYCGGDLLCVSTREESAGQVYYWFSNEEYNDQAEGDRNLYFVASSFEAFLDLLHA